MPIRVPVRVANLPRLRLARLAWVLALVISLSASAQTLSISNGVHTFPTLTNTTVTLTGRCELRITASSNAIPGCLINLNSPDACFVLPNIRPSVVVASYLSQVRVNGAVAVADNNCRVVQFGVGTIVLPHASNFQPLQVFSQPHFTGTSALLSQYVYYKGSGLGALNATISSFKLKRGYMATFAQNETGTGISRNYVAADGDMEISILPGEFDNSIRFVYVLPWRWATKKGIAGNIESGLSVQWKYNWNLDQNSTRDLEYVPIRQTRWWPSLSQNWQTRGACQLLGYNEPDRPDQSNMTIGDAIWSWPDLLATGLRLGAPAPSDGGRSSWLYPFMTQADAADLRVDFVPVHYYWCFNPSDPAGAANQFYDFLKATYDQVKRPLWITEWNNGANWTTCGDPSFAQHQAAISAIIDMLDSTPFVERYAAYNWVEDVRRLKWDDGSLTSAGTSYRDQVSPIGYVQALQDNSSRSFTHLSFDTNVLDGSGYGNNGIASGSAAFTNGVNGEALVFDGANTVVTLPPNVAKGSGFTFAGWIKWNGGADWQRIFDFGNSTTHNLFLTPNSNADTLRFGIRNGGGTQIVETSALPQNQWRHVTVTLAGNTARIFINGVLVASNTGMSITPASFSPRINFLGKSQWAADPMFNGEMDDVLITDYAMSAAQIAGLQTNTPPQFTNNIFARGSATEGIAYSNSIAGTVTDVDAGDTLAFSKAVGPAWLNVAADGTLTGTPTSGDGGTNYFTVRITDAAGQNAFALVTISVTVLTASGTWVSDANGSWNEAVRWSGNTVATGAGQTANFSTINISGNRTVALDSSRSIGTLRFGDTSGSQFWTITNTPGSALTLDTGSATSPSMIVTNTATISATVAGTNGFRKSGPGTLILNGNNPLSGTVFIDTGSSTVNDGIVRATGPGALANASTISIGNNNSGNSTFQLDGSAGSITINAQVTATYRNNSVVTFQNLAGTNIFNGNFYLFQGGSSFTVQSDSGMVVFTGTNQYVGGLVGIRTNYFTGPGHHLLVGPILNSTNGSPVSLTKSNAGTLTLEGINAYTNGTFVYGGQLIVNGELPSGTFVIASGTTIGGRGIIKSAVNLPPGATLAPGASVGKLTVNNSVALQPGSITRMEINRALQTNDQLQVTGTLTRGGTLIVTNLAGNFVPGDSFTLFQANVMNGSFSSVSLPPLDVGLSWNTNALPSGILSVIAINPPVIGSSGLQGSGEFVVTGSGSASQDYQLLAATNLNPPITWTLVTNTAADTNGLFQLTDADATNFTQRFYRISTP